ncbi:MAG: LysR family transcriptional regulator [Clostridiales bacterium]|jgi:DNA-binding transcriptional LysR family regulator|nr:LysR family transcriptional regulator [Clostridiales bacterium]
MDLNDLRFFMRIAEGMTYDAVAEQEYTSQSALSKAIFRLEKELDVKLFDRSRRSVSLTPAGKCFYGDIKKVYPGYEEALQNLRLYSEQKVLYCTGQFNAHYIMRNMVFCGVHNAALLNWNKLQMSNCAE